MGESIIQHVVKLLCINLHKILFLFSFFFDFFMINSLFAQSSSTTGLKFRYATTA